MVYWLSEALAPGIAAGDPTTRAAMRVLLGRAAEGKHLLLSPRKVVTALKAWDQQEPFESQKRGALDQLDRRLKDAPGLRQGLRVQVEVVPADRAAGWSDETRTVWRQPVGRLTDSDAAARCALLTEGEDDGRIFELAARALHAHPQAHRRPPDALKVCLRRVLGGGSQIGQELKKATEEGAPALCWVDQDDAAPGGPASPNSTAEKAFAAWPACQGPARVEWIGGREIENLLPRALLVAVLTQSGPMGPQLSGDWRRWEQQGALFPAPAGRRQQLKDQLPDGITRRCADHLLGLTEQKAAELLFGEDDGAWLFIAEVTLAWACATRRVRLS
jgi:hypothetical protein